MADRPIIFSGPMVRALLDGRKTQTRRLLTPRYMRLFDPDAPLAATHPDLLKRAFLEMGDFRHFDGGVCAWTSRAFDYQPAERTRWQGTITPAPGDRLYVREACRAVEDADGWDHIDFLAGGRRRIADTMEAADRWLKLFHYGQKTGQRPSGVIGNSVPSIHMPRWASRLTLLVESVRCEPLQSMEGQHPSESDAIAEGIFKIHHGDGDHFYHAFRNDPHPQNWCDPADAFRELWDSLHNKDGERWEDNPLVVALTFRVISGNIDQVPA